MKNILLSTLLATTSFFSFSSLHAANISSDLNVSANVEKACYINNLRNINFEYHPEATQDLIQDIKFNSIFKIKCTNGLIPLLSISNSNEGTEIHRSLTGADNQKLNYILTIHDGAGSNFGNYNNHINDGNGSSVLDGDYDGTNFEPSFFLGFQFPKGQFVKGQNYYETITVTLSY